MVEVKLAATRRTEAGSSAAAELRAQGLVPAVVYGAGQASFKVAVMAKELDRLFATGHASGLVRLEIGEGKDALTTPVLIKEIQREPVSHRIQHLDLHAVALDQAVTTAVPIVIHGEEKRRTVGGIVQHMLHHLEISALPTAIPERIEVDIAELQIGHSIQVKDLVLPNGVKAHAEPDEVVVSIVAPTKETVEVAAEGGAAAAAPAPAAKGK